MKNKQKKLIIKFLPILSFTTLVPLTVFAQFTPSNNATDIISKISNVLSRILPLLVSLGVVYFVWGVVQYVINDSEEAKTKGRDRIIFGIIGLAVIISIWGLVYILRDTFGVTSSQAPDVVTQLVPKSGNGCPASLSGGNNKLSDVLDYFTCLIGNSIIPFMFSVAVVMFVWGAIKFFIIEANEEAKREQGKQFMIWGIVALTVMISVWGLVRIVGGTFGIDNTLPQVRP